MTLHTQRLTGWHGSLSVLLARLPMHESGTAAAARRRGVACGYNRQRDCHAAEVATGRQKSLGVLASTRWRGKTTACDIAIKASSRGQPSRAPPEQRMDPFPAARMDPK